MTTVEQYAWTSLQVMIAATILAGIAALHDLTARRSVKRVPLWPVLLEARDFFVLYWRRMPVPISLVGALGVALVFGLRNHPGTLLVFGWGSALLFGAIPWALALQLGGATLAPGDVVETIAEETGELHPARLHLAAVTGRIGGATLILVAMLLTADLILSFSVTLLDDAGQMDAPVYLILTAVLSGLYVVGRLQQFIPRAGLGRGISLRRSWELTRGALFPTAVVFLAPLVVLVLLAVGVDTIAWATVGKPTVVVSTLLASLVGLGLLPFVWGAQIAMLRVLEPASEA